MIKQGILPLILLATHAINAAGIDGTILSKYKHSPDSIEIANISKVAKEEIHSGGIDYELELFLKKDSIELHTAGSIKTSETNTFLLPYMSLGTKIWGLNTTVLGYFDVVRLGMSAGLDQEELNVKRELKEMPKALYVDYNFKDQAKFEFRTEQQRAERGIASKEETEGVTIIRQGFKKSQDTTQLWTLDLEGLVKAAYYDNKKQANEDNETTIQKGKSTEEIQTDISSHQISRNAHLEFSPNKFNIKKLMLLYKSFRLKEKITAEDKLRTHKKEIDHLGSLVKYSILDNSFITFGLTDGHNILNSYLGIGYQRKDELLGFNINGIGYMTNDNNLEKKNRQGLQIIISKDKKIMKENFDDDQLHIAEYEEVLHMPNYETQTGFLKREPHLDLFGYLHRINKLERLDDFSLMLYFNNTPNQKNTGIAVLTPYKLGKLNLGNILDINYNPEIETINISEELQATLGLGIAAVKYIKSGKNKAIAARLGVRF